MTRFNIEQLTEQAETIYIEVDLRFNVAIERTDDGLEFRVYPRTAGKLWDAPFATFTVAELEIVKLEAEFLKSSNCGGSQCAKPHRL